MAETLTPNSISIHKQKPPVTSPTSPFFLGSNDDQLERAAARAARAAAFRRKPIEVRPDPRNSLSSDSCLDRHQIMELFRNCVKLATENKINQKNTWELKLIDHLSEIIQVESEDNNAETNFQKASCSLETGVKIYAVRVDAWHADAYRVLNGICRAGIEEEKDISIVGDGINKERDKGRPIKVSPLSTVESSFEALNVKKFDVVFAVDPLYHQTTAQFDEGGAKGLLLNNLGIYGGCRVLFDSEEVPAKCISSIKDTGFSNLIDIGFAGDCIEQIMMNVKVKKDICPTFSAIVDQLDEYNLEQRQRLSSQEYTCDVDTTDDFTTDLDGGLEFTNVNDAYSDDNGCELDQGSYENAEAWSFVHNDDAYQADDDNFNINNQHVENQEQEACYPSEADVYDRFGNVTSLLMEVSGIKSIQNAWAGPEHWKYRKSKNYQIPHSLIRHVPIQVKFIEVHYDKAAKQVDLHLLKETLWDHMHGFVEAPRLNSHEDAISFKEVLAAFPDDCGAAALQDISPHLCFICLLHLANEHGLAIQGCVNMDDLSIHLPISSLDTGET